jgi:hypothetical protein
VQIREGGGNLVARGYRIFRPIKGEGVLTQMTFHVINLSDIIFVLGHWWFVIYLHLWAVGCRIKNI